MWDPIVEDSGDEEAGDEFNPTWPDQDPTKHAPVIASLNLLKELPLPLEELLSLMEDCVQNGGVKKLVGLMSYILESFILPSFRVSDVVFFIEVWIFHSTESRK